jgi:iron complex transport system permease protein
MRVPLVLAGLVAGVVLLALAGLAIGPVRVPVSSLVALLTGGPVEPGHAMVVTGLRLPRVLLAVTVGASLAVAGALMQAVFRNPLAEPGLTGVSAGSALAAISVIVLEGVAMPSMLDVLGLAFLPLAAFAGGLAATALVLVVARIGGGVQTLTLLLAGIAATAVCEAGIGLLSFVSNDQQLRALTFWRMGGLGGATWPTLMAAAPLAALAAAATVLLARPLNVYLLGESEAAHTGIQPRRLRLAAVVLGALLVGASVAVSGMIFFVGLIVPHVARMLVGPDHRILLPTAALAGAALLLAADLVARMIVAPAELPIGIVTALVGAPFFLALLMRRRHVA